MALRNSGASPKKALPGEMLLVVHEFDARSPDELSLSKGDRIELIERDDDFGDGWYLGKHTQNGRTGLFPEVYTTITPKITNVSANTVATAANLVSESTINLPTTTALSRYESDHQNSPGPTPHPLLTTPSSQKSGSNTGVSPPPVVEFGPLPTQRSISVVQHQPDEESPVMNETLSVIDEHITNLNMPHSKVGGNGRLNSNDSGSDYTNFMDHRLSYIAGHETDEEEQNITRREVLKWNPSQVAEHLDDIGVEKRHCDIFKEQEITGEVLLAMDQAAIFMKEFDLGLVGQRLRTWHKIRALQEEMTGPDTPTKKQKRTLSEETSSDGWDSTLGSANGSTMSSTLVNRSLSGQVPIRRDNTDSQLSPSIRSPQSPSREGNLTPSSNMRSALDSPSRPSAASVRELNHSRRHSAVDFGPTPSPKMTAEQNGPATLGDTLTVSPHRKVPSLDRNWTVGGPSPTREARPLSAIMDGTYASTDRNTFDPTSTDQNHIKNVSRDLERGYVSGGDIESKKGRNVLRKRDAVGANHTRQSSYQADSKRLSFAGTRRHSRFGSVDSIKDTVAAMASPASKIYGNSFRGHFRNSSANEAIATSLGFTDIVSPTVTRLEYDKSPDLPATATPDQSKNSSLKDSLKQADESSKVPPKPRMGLRAISDAVTDGERAVATPPAAVPSPIKESFGQSPDRTGSTSPSAASQSLEVESTDVSSKGTTGAAAGLTPSSGTRRKSKKETSAYIRGLESKTPQEQMERCDYSGWMKKKSANIMTTWKPRLFVLRGRRLSYYYSDNDHQEKGLIDISSHRVLPADNDIITGIHATVTGAKSSPVSPATSHTPTLASEEAAALPESSLPKTNSDSMFIFKLVPPRSGLSRAVNFTKPTIHYFAVDNVRQGRLWMAALMKATIDRDESKPITTTYQQKTISLIKARAMKHRPPALMGLEEHVDAVVEQGPKSDETGLNIRGLDLDKGDGSLAHKRTGSLEINPPCQDKSDAVSAEGESKDESQLR